ncbi:hypothetical protein PENTCL1PPCAC_4245 [Pristionchus entomophagus]|uniref:Ground-like domain-containing protein n=1 Tax=Pristionchus entomophagus TaxID=358040 RepID=A0AAV5SGT4_9BILA|nr:hypothetical protein PENTCL1PPCAC_4245 [Pristionchus entomophagus]
MSPRFPLLLLLFPSSLAFLQSLLCPCNQSQCQQSSLPLCQSHCAPSCGGGSGMGGPPPSYGYGTSFGASLPSSYLPSAYQPPTLYRPLQQPQQQLQPAYNNYALPRPLPPPLAPPPLNLQPAPQIAVAFQPAADSYVGQHPTLLQPSEQPASSLPSHPPDFDSSASLIQYSTLKRGEGRSLRGASKEPTATPFTPESEESFENFERQHSKRERHGNRGREPGNGLQEMKEEELYDESVSARPENDIAFHAPRSTEEERERPSSAEGEDDETLANILKEEAETGQGSLLRRGYKWIKWAAQRGGARTKKDNHEDQLGPPLKHKCNNVELRRIMEEKMVGSPSASKQLVYSAVRAAFGRSPDVICSRSSFSYIVVSSPIYCEHKKSPSTCFVYFQP